MESRLSWIRPVPVLLFLFACWIFNQTQNEARVQMARGHRLWEEGDYSRALEAYRTVEREYPSSRYAEEALWEMGNILYIHFQDVDGALSHLHRLATGYPHGSLATEAYLRLAQIHELELADLAGAIACWNLVLSGEAEPGLRRRTRFQIGNAYLKLGRFERAFASFTRLIETDGGDPLAHRARVRLGTLLQIQNEFESSVPYFEQAMEQAVCSDCRRAARLGLIESYEFLGRLDRAIEVARTMPVSESDPGEREMLLERLENKARYYEPRLWGKD